MKIVVIKNSLFVILFVFSTQVFSQIYPTDNFNKYRIYYKTDKRTKIRIFFRMFLVENKKENDYNRVILFLKQDNSFLYEDYKIITECLGYQSTLLEGGRITSDEKKIYLEVSYKSPKENGNVFVFQKDEDEFYRLSSLQNFGRGRLDKMMYIKDHEGKIVDSLFDVSSRKLYQDIPIQWYREN